MLYSDARPDIQSGDLIAFASRSWISRLIRTATASGFSHVGIAWRFRGRVFYLFNQGGRGIALDALSTQKPFYWLPAGATWSDEVEAFALNRLGLPYDYLDDARAWLGQAATPDGICSDYAADVLRHAGLPLPAPSYTPGSLVETCLERGGTLREII